MTSDEDYLKRFLRNLNDEYISIGRDIAVLDEKIDALNEAIGTAKKAEDCVERLLKRLKKIELSRSWRGKRKREYEKGRTETIPESAEKYADDIREMIRSMRSERNRLLVKQAEATASLFSLDENIKRAERSLRELRDGSR